MTGSPFIQPKAIRERDVMSTVYLSESGEKLADELAGRSPAPVLLIGSTGWGKSVLMRHVASKLKLDYTAINMHRGMDIEYLVGAYRPQPNPSGGIAIEWSDGVLTAAIRTGRVFLAEELTRAPEEAVSRLFGLLDNGFRSWNMPEANITEVPVHEKFWFVATANPAGRGYQTSALDKALASRFIATYEINEPIADEEKILADYVDSDTAKRILNLVSDTRGSQSANPKLNTRDVVTLGQHVQKGKSLVEAMKHGVAPKYDMADGLRILAELHA